MTGDFFASDLTQLFDDPVVRIRKVIDDDRQVAALVELDHGVRADEARAAGHYHSSSLLGRHADSSPLGALFKQFL